MQTSAFSPSPADSLAGISTKIESIKSLNFTSSLKKAAHRAAIGTESSGGNRVAFCCLEQHKHSKGTPFLLTHHDIRTFALTTIRFPPLIRLQLGCLRSESLKVRSSYQCYGCSGVRNHPHRESITARLSLDLSRSSTCQTPRSSLLRHKS